MKMICEVPDEVIKCIKDGTWCGSSVAEKMITNGIPLKDMAIEFINNITDFEAESEEMK